MNMSMQFPPTMPIALAESLERYINERVETGGFLSAVLENNLREAVIRADLESARALPEIVKWLVYNAPWNCWGSVDRVQMWLAGVGKECGK